MLKTNCRYLYTVLLISSLLSGCSISKAVQPAAQTSTQSPARTTTPIIVQVSDTPTPIYTPDVEISPVPQETSTPVSVVRVTPTVDEPTLKEIPAILGAIFVAPKNGLYTIDTKSNSTVLVAQYSMLSGISWGPDGHRLSFVRTKDFSETGTELYSNPQIYIINRDGSNLIQVTHSPSNKTGTSWSPDGKTILYTEYKDNYDSDIVSVNIINGETRKLTYTPGHEFSPTWSPDGSEIAYYHQENADSDFYLYTMDAKGHNSRRVSDQPVQKNPNIAWSPDGSQIAGTTSDSWRIFIINKDGGSFRLITPSNFCADSPTWSPDREYFAFIYSISSDHCPDYMHQSLMLYQIDGGEMIKIDYEKGLSYPREVIWSPVPNLEIGSRYSISILGDGLELRSGPTLADTAISGLSEGDTVTVLDGPVDVDGFYWWKLEVVEGQTVGWAVEMQGVYVIQQ